MAVFKHNESANHAAPAAADLTGKLNYIAAIDNTGKIAICGDGAAPLGVITEENVAGASATVHFGDILKVKVATAITAGVLVASDATGLGVVAASGDYVLGIALEAATAINQVIPVARVGVGRAA